MIQKTILEALKAEYESGKTQEEIARIHNVSHVQINLLLSGKRKVGGLTLNTVCKMFPRMSVNLNGGNCPAVVADNNSIAVNGHSNNFFDRNFCRSKGNGTIYSKYWEKKKRQSNSNLHQVNNLRN